MGEDIRRGYGTNYTLDASLFESLVPSDCPAELVQLTLQCCSDEPHSRPSFKEITKLLKAVKNDCPRPTNDCRGYRESTQDSPPPPTRITKNKKSKQKQISTAAPPLPSPSIVNPTPQAKKKDKGFLKIPLTRPTPIVPEVIKPAMWTTCWDSPSIKPAIQNTNVRAVSANPLYQPVFAESPIHDHRGVWVHFEK